MSVCEITSDVAVTEISTREKSVRYCMHVKKLEVRKWKTVYS